MDGFAGYKTTAAAVVPDAVTVMDPFHVVALAGAKLDLIRQRIQQQTLGRRGHTGDPLCGIRRVARTRLKLLSTRQHARLTGVLDAQEHLAVKVAYVIYQKIIAAYADPNRRQGKKAMTKLIESIRRGVPAGLEEIAQLGRTLWRRRADILAFFDHHASNGPTEAINGRLEALRRNALGFRNLTHLALAFTPTQRRTLGVLRSAHRRSTELPGLRRRGGLPRHRDPQSHRCACRWAPTSAAGPSTALPLLGCRL
jgi:transposase